MRKLLSIFRKRSQDVHIVLKTTAPDGTVGYNLKDVTLSIKNGWLLVNRGKAQWCIPETNIAFIEPLE